MPIKRSKDSKGPYYQYGNSKKYYYKSGDSKSRKKAKRKAIKQAQAILISQHGSGLSDIVNEGISRVRGFISGPRNGPSPEIRELLKNHGNAIIEKITVCRTPIHKALDTVLNVLSLGLFNKVKKQLRYDDLFHLFMFIELSDGFKFRIEKNEVVRLTSDDTNKSEQECIPINVNKKITLGSMFAMAISRNSKFWLYDAFNNNCQDFILGMLESSGLGNQQDYKFIKQDSVYILSRLPSYVGRLSKILTDLAASGDILVRGNGL